MDFGGVFRVLSPRLGSFTRFDVGDTMIRYRALDLPKFSFPTRQPLHVPAETFHSFQFSAGVGYRFQAGAVIERSVRVSGRLKVAQRFIAEIARNVRPSP